MEKHSGKRELTKETILDAALSLSGEIGIEALTMRRLAKSLSSAPMSLYHYYKSKELLIDSMVDSVFGEILLPPMDISWKEAIRMRCQSLRKTLGKHPWAVTLMESRVNPGPLTLTHHDAVIGCFLKAGLSIELTARAVAMIDAFVYGFALQEASLPGGGGQEMEDLGEALMEGPFQSYPHLMELTRHVLSPSYHFPDIFDSGLNLILDGL